MTPRRLLIALLLVASCDHSAPRPSTAPADPDTADRTTTASPATATQTGNPPPVASPTATPPAPTPPPLPATVRISIRTSPPRKTKVYWGRKLLGMTPLQFERPRASGPIDLVLRADDYFPVHVRAYTDWNDGLTVELTKLSDRMKLFGAKRELPADPAAEGPAGPAASAAPPQAPPGAKPSTTPAMLSPAAPAAPAAPPPTTR